MGRSVTKWSHTNIHLIFFLSSPLYLMANLILFYKIWLCWPHIRIHFWRRPYVKCYTRKLIVSMIAYSCYVCQTWIDSFSELNLFLINLDGWYCLIYPIESSRLLITIIIKCMVLFIKCLSLPLGLKCYENGYCVFCIHYSIPST